MERCWVFIAGAMICFTAASSARANDAFSLQVAGRLVGDAAWIEDSDENFDVASTELRYARIGVKGKVFSKISYKLDVDFAGENVATKDANISFALNDKWKMSVGQMAVFNTMEGLTSGRFTSVMSRAAFTEALGSAREIGVGFERRADTWTLSLGAYRGTVDEGTEDAGRTLAGRLTWSPVKGGNRLHLGTYIVSRQAGGDSLFGYSARPFFHLAPARLVSTGGTGSQDLFYGLEAAIVTGPLWITGEAGFDRADHTPTHESPTLHGGYFELGYFLTGESRSYNAGRGVWDRQKVDRPLGQGPGAWALVARYDALDLSDKSWTGGTQETIIAGLNWFPNRHTRLTVNYSRSEIAHGLNVALNGADGKNTVSGLGLRAQVDF